MNNSSQFVIRQGKIPVSHVTGFPIDPLDRKHWLPQQTAAGIAESWGPCYGIGYVLADSDPYFLLDLDHCVDVSGQWSELAQQFQQEYRGCYMERSQSGTGMHIIGRADSMAHRCRVKGFPVELYTDSRMIALTGTEAVGSCEMDVTTTLSKTIEQYFAPTTSTEQAQEWTTEPVPGYTSKHSDQELIEIALRPRARDVFGGLESFEQLWRGNYVDHSAADLQLCNHLAFWTGGNCERIERLFGMSGLVRPKWTDREDYRQRTILEAVSGCSSYFSVSQRQGSDRLGFRWNVVFPETESNGKPMATAENLKYLLDMAGVVCRHNAMNHQDEIIVPGLNGLPELQYRSACSKIRSLCASTRLSSAHMLEYLDEFCSDEHYHPAKDWIDSVPWDGVDRIGDLVASLNADNTAAAAVFLRRWLISAVVALYNHRGVTSGGMIVLQGPQGIGKNRVV